MDTYIMETVNDEMGRREALYDIIQSGQTLELASVYSVYFGSSRKQGKLGKMIVRCFRIPASCMSISISIGMHSSLEALFQRSNTRFLTSSPLPK